MKKGDWSHFKDCKRVKNHKLFASCSHGSVVTQLANEMIRDNKKKVVQFASILHLLQQGCPMQKYEAIRPLYGFFVVPKDSKKHSNDNSGWTIGKIHALRCDGRNKAIMGVVWYVVLSCDEMFIVDNQSWLSIHC